MMKILREDFTPREEFRANEYDQVRLSEVAEERCGLCFDRWPKSMMLDNDGTRRCPDCYEERDIEAKNAIIAHDNHQRATRQTRPQVSEAPLKETAIPFIRTMETAAGTRVLASSPLNLSRGGAAVQLILKGGNFKSTDTFSYSSGISNSIAASLSGTSQWTLTLVASGGMTAGQWHLTYNNHTYRNIFSVR